MCYYDCPEGMDDVGVSCHKQHYNRGMGKPLKCRNDQEYDAGLCYHPCSSPEMHGEGSVCYGQCPPGTQACGLDVCLAPGDSCIGETLDLTLSLEVIVEQLILTHVGDEINIAEGNYTHKFPRCDSYNVNPEPTFPIQFPS